MIFQLSDWFPKPMIWAIIVKFDQIRKNWWRISCAEILEVGKNFFAASSVKKMSRFEEVSPEEIKRIVDNATPINTKRSTKYGLKIFNTYSPVQTTQRSSHVVDRSSHDRSTISATATSKFTTTTASPAEQLIVKEKCHIVTLFVRSKL